MDDAAFLRLFARLEQLLHLDLRDYKQPQMRRRISSFAARHAAGDLDALIECLDQEPDVLRGLRDLLTINVTDFFRDSAQWMTFEEQILPALLRGRSPLRIWSAGCSFGQEPLSIAIALDRLGALQRARILATDYDDLAIARASAGGPYSDEEVKGIAESDREQYFSRRADGYVPTRRLLARIEFREMNLLRDRFDRDFDLIVCRNVMIYLDAGPRVALLQRFRDALRPGGVLFIGATEALLGREAEGFQRMGGNFYQRHPGEWRLTA